MTSAPDFPVRFAEPGQNVCADDKISPLGPRLIPAILLLLAIASILLATGIVLEFGVWTQEEVIHGPFRTESATRTAWVPLGQTFNRFSCCVGARPDDDEHTGASSLRAWLNGRELGPAHTPHDDIRSGKTAGFSHWEDRTIRFFLPVSVANDRTASLRVRYPVQYSIEFFDLDVIVIIVLAMLIAVQMGVPTIVWFVATAGISAYIAAVYLFESPPVPLITPDTGSYWYSPLDHYIYSALYIDALSMRPLGYAAVLHTVFALTGNFKYIPALQSGTYCLSVLALQTAVWRLTRNIVFASILAVVLLLYGGLLVYSQSATPDQLFTSLLIFHVAAAAWALASRSRIALMSMGVTAVGVVSLRPAGTFVLVAILLFCSCWRGNRIFALRWALLPLAIGMAIFMGAGLAVRGIAIDRLAGWAAFPYVAYLYDGGGDLPPVAKQTIIETLRPYIKGHEEAERSGIVAVANYEANHFNEITYGLVRRLAEVYPPQGISALEGRLAVETIERHPVQYLRLAFMTFVAGFRQYALGSYPIGAINIQSDYRQMRQPIQALSKMVRGLEPFDVDTDWARYGLVRDYPLPQLPNIWRWHRWAQILFWIIALVSTFVAAFQHPSRLGYLTAYSSILALGGYMFIAMTTVFISRYTAPLDAFLIVTIASGLLEGLRMIRRKLSAPVGTKTRICTLLFGVHGKI